ncbi:CLUMA_CG019207, isoform A [Clunio marinus]|uniref:CLUMA_CG019207, isoform A n=1 Tax=Clunio marinus TaxID=568069 RepID=A0A1J1J2B6_9DIPT|nr:CLUMA_CG019207, isoform A [Clunio marinus]
MWKKSKKKARKHKTHALSFSPFLPCSKQHEKSIKFVINFNPYSGNHETRKLKESLAEIFAQVVKSDRIKYKSVERISFLSDFFLLSSKITLQVHYSLNPKFIDDFSFNSNDNIPAL